jgi:hypothetical protein
VFAEGFFINQAQSQERRAFLMGQFSDTGWWYFFPLAVLIKTPLSLLALAAAGVAVWRGGRSDAAASRRDGGLTLTFLLVPVLGFLVPPMLTHLNIGLRHVLTIYPFLIMLAAAGMAGVRQRWPGQAPVIVAVAGALWLFEYGRAFPHPLAFFNTLIGGPAHGAEYLVDSNLDWGQDLKGLKAWMDERRVPEINLAYFGSADPAYYGIRARYLNGALPYVRNDQVRPPSLPGYVAVSATLESGALAPDSGRDAYWGLRQLEPVAVIGYSIKVYWVDRPWWN